MVLTIHALKSFSFLAFGAAAFSGLLLTRCGIQNAATFLMVRFTLVKALENDVVCATTQQLSQRRERCSTKRGARTCRLAALLDDHGQLVCSYISALLPLLRLFALLPLALDGLPLPRDLGFGRSQQFV